MRRINFSVGCRPNRYRLVVIRDRCDSARGGDVGGGPDIALKLKLFRYLVTARFEHFVNDVAGVKWLRRGALW